MSGCRRTEGDAQGSTLPSKFTEDSISTVRIASASSRQLRLMRRLDMSAEDQAEQDRLLDIARLSIWTKDRLTNLRGVSAQDLLVSNSEV